MSYLGFFDLHAEPFAHAPSDKFYYASQQHTDALNRLTHAVRSMQGLALLVGDIGRGKSTLARRLLNALPDHEFEATMMVVVHAAVSADWLLRRIALNLGVKEPSTEKLGLISQLYQRLVQIYDSGKRAVVLVDEAQMLATRQLMEEFRGLLNLEVPGHKLITFVFFGLPELEANLRLDPPLAQRVVLKCALKALNPSDTAAYVSHRLALAGSDEEIFPPDAMLAVHTQTQGVPRLINTLCDNAMLELFFARQRVATPQLVNDVARNLNMDASASSLAAYQAAPMEMEAKSVPSALPGLDDESTDVATTTSPTTPMQFSGKVKASRNIVEEAEDIAHLVAEEQDLEAHADTPIFANTDLDIPMTFDPPMNAPMAASSKVPPPNVLPAAVAAAAKTGPTVRGTAAPRTKSSTILLDEVDELLAEISKF